MCCRNTCLKQLAIAQSGRCWPDLSVCHAATGLQLSGVNLHFIAQDWALEAGRQFLESEVRGGRAACIIGKTVRDELFGPSAFLGRSVRVNKVSCEVIGLLQAKGQSSFGSDRDDVVLLPLRAFQRRLAGNTDIPSILVSADQGVDTGKVQADIERLLRERRNVTRGQEDDFSVRDMKEIVETQTGMTVVLTGLLGAVEAHPPHGEARPRESDQIP